MDSNGTSTSHQDSGKAQGDGYLHTANFIARRNKVMAFIFLLSMVLSVLLGVLLPERSTTTAVFASVILGLFIYGAGIVSAIIFHRDEISLFIEAASLERTVRNKIFLKQVEDVIRRERRECGEKMIAVAKVVSDRVATRILAKYVDGLSESRKREIVLQDVDEILKEELAAFSDAVKDESKKVAV